jgi:hypothetical protein
LDGGEGRRKIEQQPRRTGCSRSLAGASSCSPADGSSYNEVANSCQPLPLDELYLATAATRPCPWLYAATYAAITLPGDAVQGLAGSPGWIVFGSDGCGDRVAIDLTPGPRGNIGQVIMIDRVQPIGAGLYARSLTAMVKKPPRRWSAGRPAEMPFVARVNRGALHSIEAAAGPDLEVLSIGAWEGEPLSLAPVAGLPRLRTLTALPGTLADPLEITRLTGLEFLALGPEEWRILLDADAVPAGLRAAAVEPHGSHNPLPLVAIANELLARWDRPLITKTLIEGDFNEALPGPGVRRPAAANAHLASTRHPARAVP